MGLTAILVRRSLLGRPGRTLFSVMGVAVGIATVVAIFTLDHITLLSRSVGRQTEWKADLEVRPGREVEDPRADLSGLDGVGGVSAVFQKDALFRTPERSGSDVRPSGRRVVRLIAMDASAGAQIGAWHLMRGAEIDPTAFPPEVLIGRALSEEFQLGPGDELFLAKPPRTARRVCREGEIRTVGETLEPVDVRYRIAGVMSHENIGRRSMGQVVVVDIARGMELYHDAFVDSSYWIKRDEAVDIERLEASLAGRYDYATNRSAIVGQQADERAFRNGVRLAGLLALVLGLFVIFHTLSMSLVERVQEVATLHALGAGRGQIARVFFGEALTIALLAGALGLGGGLGLARMMLKRGITTLGVHEPVDLFSVPWTQVGSLVAIGVGIALLGSIFPLLRARGTDSVRALRGEDVVDKSKVTRGFHIFAALLLAVVLPAMYFFIVPVVGETDAEMIGIVFVGLGVLTLLVGVPLLAPSLVSFVCRRLARPFEQRWPLAGKLAARSIEQSPSRIAGSVAAIALVTAAFVGLKGMTNSLRGETETWAAEAVVDKIWVNGLPNVPFAAVSEKLLEYPGVLAVEPGSSKVSTNQMQLVGIKESELEAYGPLAEDPTLAQAMREGQGVIVSRRVALHMGWEVGQSIQVNTNGSGVQSFPVVAISDAYGYSPHPDERMYGVVSDSHLERLFCIDTATVARIAVRMQPPADPTVVETALRELLPNAPLHFESGRQVLDHHLSDIGRDFFLFDIIFGLTAILAALGVLNGQLLAALERSKELGVLRALGTTRRQVAGLVLLESLVVGGCGGLLGLALGGLLTPVIVESLQVISGLPLPHKSAGVHLASCLVGALALTLVAGLYPIWRMNRFDAVRAVRTG